MSSLQRLFDAPTRVIVAVLWFVGAAFAATAAVLTLMRPGAGPYGAFLVPTAALVFIAVALLRLQLWAMAVSFLLLAGQVVGVVGTTLQLAYGIDAGKAEELRALGVEPRFGVAINLAFSFAATCVLAVSTVRAVRRSRHTRGLERA
jgi:hypothetical protein